MESGPDLTYQITISAATYLTVKLSNMTADLDVFLMTNTNSASCIAFGNDTLAKAVQPGTYYVNVDGFQGASSNYNIQFLCSCIPGIVNVNCGDRIDKLTFDGAITMYTACGDTINPNYTPNGFTYAAKYGDAVPFSIRHSNVAEYDRVYIDFNLDGDYEDDGELVKDWKNPLLNRMDNFYLPANHSTNSDHDISNTFPMRIACTSNPFSGTSSCQTVDFGSSIDGKITLSSPVTNVTYSFAGLKCLGGTYTLTADLGVDTIPAGTLYTFYYWDGSFNLISAQTPSNTFSWTIPFGAPLTIDPNNVSDGVAAYNTKFYGSHPVKLLDVDFVPTVSTVTGAMRCGTGTVQLQSTTSSGLASWFGASSGGAALGTSLNFTTPSVTGNTTYYVAARTAAGCFSETRSPATVTVNPAPAITSFTPTSGIPGTVVTVTGTNMTGVTGMYFNNLPAAYAYPISATQVTTTVPSAATTGTLKMVKSSCTQTASAGTFTVLGSTLNTNDYRWVRQAKGSGIDRYNRIRVTPDRNVYSAGSFSGTCNFDQNGGGATTPYTSSGGLDGMLARYNRSGVLQWVARFGSASGDDEILGLAVDKFGYAYVSGTFVGGMTIKTTSPSNTVLLSAGGSDMFVAKIHPDGHLVYAFRMGASGNDRAEGVDVAPDLRVYVAGSFVGTTQIGGISGTVIPLTSRGNSDAFLAKFTDVGTLYWAIQAGGTGNDFGYGAAADISGGGYLMGSYEGTATFNSSLAGTTPIMKTVVGGSDGFVLGVSITGQLNWVASMGGSTNENVRDLAPDPQGTGVVAVGGFSSSATFGSLGSISATGFYDAFAVRLTNSGAFSWVQKAGGFGQDQAWAVRLDKTGQPVIGMSFGGTATLPGGGTATSQGALDGLVMKLTSGGGSLLYSAQVAGLDGDDQVRGVDTADGGGAYIAGFLGGTTRFGLLGPYANSGLGDGYLARFANGNGVREGLNEDNLASTVMAAPGTIRLAPNPVGWGQGFDISAEGLTGRCRLVAYDASGKAALQLDLTAQGLTQGTRITSNLPAGLYTLHLSDEQGNHRKVRLVIE